MTPIIRKAIIEDACSIAQVHTLSWRTTYQGIVADSYLTSLDIDAKAEWWVKAISQNASVYIAETNTIIGFATAGKNREHNQTYRGELYALYLLKEYQGKGIGKILFDEVVKELLSRSISSMLVWVLKDNPSKGFYIRQGGKFIEEKEIEIDGQKLIEEAYGWKDLTIHASH